MGKTEYGDLEITINLSKPEKNKRRNHQSSAVEGFQLSRQPSLL